MSYVLFLIFSLQILGYCMCLINSSELLFNYDSFSLLADICIDKKGFQPTEHKIQRITDAHL